VTFPFLSEVNDSERDRHVVTAVDFEVVNCIEEDLDDRGLLVKVEEEGKAFEGTTAFDQSDEEGSVSQSGDM
jgi:hypothetical protein